MTNIFVLFSTLIFGLESFSFLSCLYSNSFLKFLLLKRNPRSYVFILFPIQNFLFCHVTFWHSLPKTLAALDQVRTPISNKSQAIFGFYSIYFSSKTISVIIYGPRWFAKGVPNFFWVLIPNQLLWLVLSTLNLDPSRSTCPQFKFFKFCLLQVWTRFAIFSEIHYFILQKFWEKSGSP